MIKKFLRFLPDVKAARGRSKDRSTKVGAIALDDDYVIKSSGYNGFPRGVNDDEDSRHERPAKYDWTMHAEMNVVAQAARPVLQGTTLLISELHPCSICAGLLIQAGVKRVITPLTEAFKRSESGRVDWDEKAAIAMQMLAEAGVEVLYYEEDSNG